MRELIEIPAPAFNAEAPCLLVVPIDYRENLKLTERLGEIGAVI